MSSLIQAFKNWVRGKKDDAADKMADPVRDAKFAIEDSEKLVGEFEAKIADLMAHNKRTALEVEAAQRDVTKWSNVAASAAKAGNRADCETAVKQKAEAQQKADRMAHEKDTNDQIIAGLRKQLDATRDKIEHAKSNKEVLAARMDGAKIREQLTKASTAMEDGGPLAALDTLERKTVECETHAEAIEELHDNKKEDLEEKYSQVNADVQSEVDKLMAAQTAAK